MLSATVMPIRVTRACGHSESEEFRYRTVRDRNQQAEAARRVVCRSCRVMIQGWLELANETPYQVQLPVLSGSDKQVKWAESIRANQLKSLLPAMAAAAAHGDKIGAAVWQALYVIVMQRQARFWIDNREVGFSHYYVEAEATYFAMTVTFGVTFSERSIFGYLKKNAPHVIEDARRRCPVAPALSIA
ncbi:hypothetical protein [Stutzerimonas stutzeri]|uniref:hypothetical protein n=1 Tax=Stutzerimonas stutzeri TaxID=316 RepID=UPI00265D151E|nr:hypothetical protein [Stutzerimonas stutzeri]MCF6783367.1 hypothetical protein [Stutzerimonas stutzeri]